MCYSFYMSLSVIIIRLIGIVLAIVGLALLLAAVGINFLGVATPNIWIDIVVGVIFLGAGIWIIRGGTVTL